MQEGVPAQPQQARRRGDHRHASPASGKHVCLPWLGTLRCVVTWPSQALPKAAASHAWNTSWLHHHSPRVHRPGHVATCPHLRKNKGLQPYCAYYMFIACVPVCGALFETLDGHHQVYAYRPTPAVSPMDERTPRVRGTPCTSARLSSRS